jgi:hypothetical protein
MNKRNISILDVLRAECPAEHLLSMVLWGDWIDSKTLRLFAATCARKALAATNNPDTRSVAACDTAENYANELVNSELLAFARNAALDAAFGAERPIARATAVGKRPTAVEVAAAYAAKAAFAAAAKSPAAAACWAAEWAAIASTFSGESREKVCSEQVDLLVEMLEEE